MRENNQGGNPRNSERANTEGGAIILGVKNGGVSGKNRNFQRKITENLQFKMQDEGKYANVETNGLVITDPKRKRLGLEDGSDKTIEQDVDTVMDTQEGDTSNQKNEFLAGSAL